MKALRKESVENQWTRAGILLQCAPARSSPDLERLLLTTASRISENARLLPLVVTWLVEHGTLVAKHRLKRLIVDEGDTESRAVLGLVLESALSEGAPRDLGVVIEVCRPTSIARPLFEVQQKGEIARRLAERHASSLSRKWGVLAPEFELKRDAVRPISWILEKNPSFRDRAIRKGDLRCSVLESLRWDGNGSVRSESELARLSGATRAGVRKALAALVREGEVEVGIVENARDRGVRLKGAA